MRRRSSGRSGRRPLRGMDWDNANIQSSVGARGPTDRGSVFSGYVVLPSDVRNRWVDPTLMATRTFIQAWNAGATTNEVFVGCGLIMWSDINDTAPSGADCPDPLRDGDLDWINRWVFLFAQDMPIRTPGNSNIFDNTHLSKAKRRFGQDQGLLFAISALENTTSNIGIDVLADVRALIKE